MDISWDFRNDDSRARQPSTSEQHAGTEREARGHPIGLARDAGGDGEAPFPDFNRIADVNPETKQQVIGHSNGIFIQASSSGVQFELAVKGVLRKVRALD